MPVWKLDLVFEARGRGWQETYYRNFTGPGLASAVTVATTLAQKRIALSGAPVEIKAYRITDPLTEGVQGQPVYFNPVVTPPGDAGENGASDPATAIVTGWRVDEGTSGRRLWLRGVWDAAIRQFGQLNSPEYANWLALFGQYRSYCLQQQFGWMRTVRAGTRAKVSYDYDVDPLIPRFTFPANWFDEVQVDTFQKVRFSKFNNSRSPLNREMVVYVTARNQAVAAEPIAAGPMVNSGRAIRYGTPQFTVATAIVVDRTGRRAPGSPLLLTPGRARNRARS